MKKFLYNHGGILFFISSIVAVFLFRVFVAIKTFLEL
jgi:hypothetical protein